MKTNFFGTLDVSRELLPLVKPQGESEEPMLSCFWHGLSLPASGHPFRPLLPLPAQLHWPYGIRAKCLPFSLRTLHTPSSVLFVLLIFAQLALVLPSEVSSERTVIAPFPHTLAFPEGSMPDPPSYLSLSE